MAIVCSVYGSEHRKLKRRILALSFLDLIFITSTVVFVITQIISVGVAYQSLKNGQNETDVSPNDDPVTMSLVMEDTNLTALNVNNLNCTIESEEGCGGIDDEDDDFEYRTVVGARISLSIQLLIYLAQLGFGILLFFSAYHNDSKNLHMWVLFSEVMVVVICLNLFINFFGKFAWVTAIITLLYIVYKIVLIRLVRKFIHVNDLALTQFGSVNEFE